MFLLPINYDIWHTFCPGGANVSIFTVVLCIGTSVQGKVLHLPGRRILLLMLYMWVQHVPLKLWYVHMKQHGMKTVIVIFTVVRISNLTGCYLFLYLFLIMLAVMQCIVEWYDE